MCVLHTNLSVVTLPQRIPECCTESHRTKPHTACGPCTVRPSISGPAHGWEAVCWHVIKGIATERSVAISGVAHIHRASSTAAMQALGVGRPREPASKGSWHCGGHMSHTELFPKGLSMLRLAKRPCVPCLTTKTQPRSR